MQLTALSLALTRAGFLQFTPASLFQSGSQGVWYDPSDYTTLFEDSAGTIPITSPLEKPVGKMLDKSGRGNHATQSTTTSRPTLSARYNLLTKTEDFADAYWGKTNVTVTPNAAVAPDGTLTADMITATATSVVVVNNNTGISTGSGTYTASVYVAKNRNFTLYFSGNTSGIGANFNGTSGAYVSTTSTGSGYTIVSYAIENVGSFWRASIVVSTTDTGIKFIGFAINNSSGTTWRSGWDSVIGDTLTIWGADLRVANDGVGLPAYQRVNTATDFAVDGFPAAEVFDGTDDNQITAAGGGSTTAFFWCSSIRVGKVGAVQTLFSDTSTNAGYRVRINASNQLELAAGNNTTYITATTSDALTLGQRAVLTAWHDGANLNVQINNGTVVQTAFVTATAGTAQITIGKDNNAASSFFMGRLYEKVYLKDTVLSAASIASTKSFCATKAKVTL